MGEDSNRTLARTLGPGPFVADPCDCSGNCGSWHILNGDGLIACVAYNEKMAIEIAKVMNNGDAVGFFAIQIQQLSNEI